MSEAVRTAVKAPGIKKEIQVSQVQKDNFNLPASSPVEQILFLQRTIGNQAVQRLMKSGALQAKLRIGAPGDVYEQEADRVADAVMRMPQPQAVSSGTPGIQRACPKYEEEELKRQPIKEEDEEKKLQRKPLEENEEELQAKATSGSISEVNPDIESHIQSLKGGGKPLSENDRTFFEPRFGHDFSGVRVHTDEKAAGLARAVNAHAFTVGNDLVFGTGQYEPGTSEGRRLLAHELTHVVQQGTFPAKLETHPSSSHPPPVSIMPGGISRLQRAECSIKHVEDECNNAASSCKTVEDECKKRYPKPSDIDTAVQKGREQSKTLASSAPNAAANMLHFLDGTGTEKVMPAAVFETHAETKKALLKHRQKFLDGTRKRLEAGSLTPGSLSEQMVWTDTANAFSFFTKDDLGYAVGGYTLCSKVRVQAKSLGAGRFEVTFVEWSVQAFDCYNWDPGKGVGIPGASDTDMCCIENAGKGKHFRVRTDAWKNSDADSTKTGEVNATLPPSGK